MWDVGIFTLRKLDHEPLLAAGTPPWGSFLDDMLERMEVEKEVGEGEEVTTVGGQNRITS